MKDTEKPQWINALPFQNRQAICIISLDRNGLLFLLTDDPDIFSNNLVMKLTNIFVWKQSNIQGNASMFKFEFLL